MRSTALATGVPLRQRAFRSAMTRRSTTSTCFGEDDALARCAGARTTRRVELLPLERSRRVTLGRATRREATGWPGIALLVRRVESASRKGARGREHRARCRIFCAVLTSRRLPGGARSRQITYMGQGRGFFEAQEVRDLEAALTRCRQRFAMAIITCCARRCARSIVAWCWPTGGVRIDSWRRRCAGRWRCAAEAARLARWWGVPARRGAGSMGRGG